MKLYYAETLMPRKACALARHLNSPVEFVRVALEKGEQHTPAFATINPNRKVPVLDTGVAVVWEADAIMCHLARFAGSDLWPTDDRQVDVTRWLGWSAQHFTRHAGALYFEHIIKPHFGLGRPNAGEIEQATELFRRYAAVLNDHLAGRKYLVADALSVADFAVAVTLPYADEARIPLGEFPEIARWHARLNELPAWREPFPKRQAVAA